MTEIEGDIVRVHLDRAGIVHIKVAGGRCYTVKDGVVAEAENE